LSRSAARRAASTSCRAGTSVDRKVQVSDELLDGCCGLFGEGLAVLDGQPAASAGVQHGLHVDGIRCPKALSPDPRRRGATGMTTSQAQVLSGSTIAR
jgi:hypothetical protein